MIGKHEPKRAENTDVKAAVTVCLDEALTALEEAIHDLTDEQAWAFPIPGRNNIAWIVMHTLQNLDTYTRLFATGETTLGHDWRWDLWKCIGAERPKPEDGFPGTEEMLDILRRLRGSAMQVLDATTEADLLASPSHTVDFWKGRNQLDAYLRTLGNTHAHVRQIWLLRGALGLTEGKSWPQQHWA